MQIHKEHLTENQKSNTFTSIQNIMHVTTAQAKSRQALPSMLWEDKDRFRYHGQMYSMTSISDAIEYQKGAADEVLANLVLMHVPVEELMPRYVDVQDRHRSDLDGYSFLSDPANPFLDAKDNLAKALFMHESWGCHFSNDDQTSFRPEAMKVWLRDVQTFLGHLFFLIHTTSGLPPRGTESAAMLLCNTAYQRRNLYYLCGNLCLVGTYNKTSHNTGFDKLIPRAMHKSVEMLLLIYLTLVRPIEKRFARDLGITSNLHLYDTHIWIGTDGKWTTRHMTDILQQSFGMFGDIRIGIGAWRHIITNIVRKKVNTELCLHPLVLNTVLLVAANEQAGHSHEMALSTYGLDCEGLTGMTEETLNLFLAVSLESITNQLHLIPP